MRRSLLPIPALVLSIAALAAPSRTAVPVLTVADEGGAALALEIVNVRTIVRGHLLRTEYELTYRNSLRRDVSGDFDFPLPEGAEVSDIALYFDGKLRHGFAVERAQAKAAYEETIHRRVDPALAEWKSGRSFRFRVFPIPARGTKTVRIAYDQELTSKPFALDLHYGVTLQQLDVVIDAGDARVESTLPLVRSGGTWELHRTRALLDDAITIERDPLDVALVAFSAADNLWYASAPLRVTHHPAPVDPSSHVVLLWDASGSAADRDDAAVRAFLRAFVARQRAGAGVTLIPFALDAGAPREVSAVALDAALEETPESGATNLVSLLESLPKLVAGTPADSRLLLVTDGVSTLGDRERVSRAVAGLATLHRQITVVTASPSNDDALLRSIAAATNGWLLDLGHATADDASIAAMLAPAQRLIRGESPLLRDVLPGSADQSTIIANASSPQRILSLAVSVDGDRRELTVRDAGDAGDLVRRAWARARLRQLIEGRAGDEQLVEHGRRFNQLTPRTSLLILETWRDYVRNNIPLPEDLRQQKEADEKEAMRQLEKAPRDRGKVTIQPSTDGQSSIRGLVIAKDGNVLPGVTVTARGGGSPQTVVTDAQGSYRFPNLSAGTYWVTAELAGFVSATHRDVAIETGQIANLTLTLIPAVSESITVTAESPLLDTRRVGTTTTVSTRELERVPTSRDPWRVLQRAPSVTVDGVNVGGNESIQLPAWSLQHRHADAQEAVQRLRAIRSTNERFRQYLLVRKTLRGEKLFHVAAAEEFRDTPEIALRVLSDLADSYPDDAPLLRILGRVAAAWGRPDIARLFLERALELSPRETPTWRELLLLAAKQGDDEQLTRLKSRFASAQTNHRLIDLEPIIDRELARRGGADPRADASAELQVESMWDSDYSDVDLHVIEPGGEEVFYGHEKSGHDGWLHGDVTDGFGPETYTIPHAQPGEYQVSIDYYRSDAVRSGAETLVHLIVYQRGQRSDHLLVLGKDKERVAVTTIRVR